MMTNHVLFDCERTKYPNTGLFQFCLQLGNELIKQADPLQEDLFFYLPEKQTGLFGDNPQYIIQRRHHKIFQPRTSRFNVWHTTFQSSVYKPYNNKTRVVLTIHDLNFIIEQPAHKTKKYLAHIQKNIDRADHIIFISSFTKQMVQQHLQLKDKPAQVIYNGCTIDEFPGFDEPLYRPVSPFLFALGTVMPKKNFHVLPCLLKNNDYELVIAGIVDKQYELKIWEEAARYGVTNRVKILGPVNGKDKYWYYKNCLAFTFPSLAEGFGLPVLEAMYYGKPVFISRLTSLPEIGGDQAYYFNSFDAADMQHAFEQGMQHYINYHPATAIRNRALQFSWANTASACLSVYRSLYNK